MIYFDSKSKQDRRSIIMSFVTESRPSFVPNVYNGKQTLDKGGSIVHTTSSFPGVFL